MDRRVRKAKEKRIAIIEFRNDKRIRQGGSSVGVEGRADLAKLANLIK